jgi:hypothetical protein
MSPYFSLWDTYKNFFKQKIYVRTVVTYLQFIQNSSYLTKIYHYVYLQLAHLTKNILDLSRLQCCAHVTVCQII